MWLKKSSKAHCHVFILFFPHSRQPLLYFIISTFLCSLVLESVQVHDEPRGSSGICSQFFIFPVYFNVNKNKYKSNSTWMKLCLEITLAAWKVRKTIRSSKTWQLCKNDQHSGYPQTWNWFLKGHFSFSYLCNPCMKQTPVNISSNRIQ